MEPDGSLLPLDEDAASPPAWKRTWFIALVMGLVRKKTEPEPIESDEDASNAEDAPAQSKKQRKAARRAQKNLESDGLDDQSSSDIGSSGVSTPINGATKPGQRGPTVMTGGRRRKAVPRKRPERKNAEVDTGAEVHDS